MANQADDTVQMLRGAREGGLAQGAWEATLCKVASRLIADGTQQLGISPQHLPLTPQV